MLSNPNDRLSGGNCDAQSWVVPVSDRSVLLYCVRLSRRTVTTPTSGLPEAGDTLPEPPPPTAAAPAAPPEPAPDRTGQHQEPVRQRDGSQGQKERDQIGRSYATRVMAGVT